MSIDFLNHLFCTYSCEINAGQLARHQYECMRREAASLKIQKHFRMHLSQNAYKTIYAAAVCIQTGMRGMDARNNLRFRRRAHAAIVIQVGLDSVFSQLNRTAINYATFVFFSITGLRLHTSDPSCTPQWREPPSGPPLYITHLTLKLSLFVTRCLLFSFPFNTFLFFTNGRTSLRLKNWNC